MVAVAGAPVESVAPVDPAGIVVSLVIDDGPTVAGDVVEDAQGASVELVRNVGEGTADRAGDAERDAERRSPPTAGPTSPGSPASPPARPMSCRCPSSCSDEATRLAESAERTATS